MEAVLIIGGLFFAAAALAYYGGLGVYMRSGSRMYALLLVIGLFTPAAIISLPILGWFIPDGWHARHGRKHRHVSHDGMHVETSGPLADFRRGFERTYH